MATILRLNLRSPAATLAGMVLLSFVFVGSLQAQTFRVIYDFNENSGWSPFAGLTRDAAGNFYGTTGDWGPGPGGVYELKPAGGQWVLNPLFMFNHADGAYPGSGVVFGPNGALYGATAYGGTNNCSPYGCGLVYKLTPPSTSCKAVFCYWSESVLYEFTGGGDGESPSAGNLIFDSAGNIYGTTHGGGAAGMGTVYKLTPSGGGWAEKVLYSFTGGNDGANPASGLARDTAGNLYGTTEMGGNLACAGQGCGIVFEVSPSGPGWTEHILHVFEGFADGAQPEGGVIFDASGNLYGSTFLAGAGGAGTVFELSPSSGGWNFSVVYALPGPNGGGPTGNLATDSAGNLYGITFAEGAYDLGSVFQLTRSCGGWTYTMLHSFRDDSGGYWPDGSPVLDSLGNVYGTTSQGGANPCGFETYCGVVWEITP